MIHWAYSNDYLNKDVTPVNLFDEFHTYALHVIRDIGIWLSAKRSGILPADTLWLTGASGNTDTELTDTNCMYREPVL